MNDDLRRWINTALLILFAVSGLIYSRYGYGMLLPAGDEFVNHKGDIVGGDFLVFYNAAVMTLKGMSASVWDHAAFDAHLSRIYGQEITQLHFFNPPVALLIWTPFGLLHHVHAVWLWTVIPLLILGFTIYRLTADTVATGLTVIAPLTAYTAGAGQTGILLTAVFALFVLHQQDRPAVAGAVTALYAIKPHLAIILPIGVLLDRNWRAFAAMIATGVIFCLAATILFGWQVWFAFLDSVRYHSSEFFHAGNQTFDRTPSILLLALKLGQSKETAWGAQLLVTFASVGAFVFIWTRSADVMLRAFALALAMCLLTPKVVHYDAMVLLVPIAMLIARARQGRAETGLLLFSFLIWCLPYFEPAFRNWGFHPGGLLLFAGLAWIAYKQLARQQTDTSAPAVRDARHG